MTLKYFIQPPEIHNSASIQRSLCERRRSSPGRKSLGWCLLSINLTVKPDLPERSHHVLIAATWSKLSMEDSRVRDMSVHSLGVHKATSRHWCHIWPSRKTDSHPDRFDWQYWDGKPWIKILKRIQQEMSVSEIWCLTVLLEDLLAHDLPVASGQQPQGYRW